MTRAANKRGDVLWVNETKLGGARPTVVLDALEAKDTTIYHLLVGTISIYRKPKWVYDSYEQAATCVGNKR